MNIVGTILLARSLKPVIGPFITPRFRRAMIVIALSSAVLAGVSYGVWDGLDMLLGRTLPAQIVSLLLALALGGLAYLWMAKRLGLDELRGLAQMRRARATEHLALLAEVRRADRQRHLAEREPACDLVEQEPARAAPAPPTRARGAGASP